MTGRSILRLPAQFESKSFLVGLALTVLLCALWFVPAIHALELRMLDIFFQLKGPPPPHPGVLHVDIDDSSIEKIGRWPWDRVRHAQLVDILTETGARAIVFDVTFPDLQSPDNDEAFVSSCAESGLVYIGYNLPLVEEFAFKTRDLPWYRQAKKELLCDITLEPGELAGRLGIEAPEVEPFATRVLETVIEEELRQAGGGDGEAAAAFERAGGFVARTARRISDRLTAEAIVAGSALPADTLSDTGREAFLVPPFSALARAARGCGFVSVEPDSRDGILRHIPVLRKYRGMHGYLSLVVLRDLEEMEIRPSSRGIALHSAAGTLEIPLNRHGELLLDWARMSDFERVPCAAVIQIADMREAALSNLCQDAITATGLNKRLREVCEELAQLRHSAAVSPDPAAFRERLATRRKMRDAEVAKLLAQVERFVESARRRGIEGDGAKQVDEFDRLARATRKLLESSKRLAGEVRKFARGKICIVGSTHTGSTDLHPTPIATEIPGCMAHSTFLSMLSAHSFPREPVAWSSLILLVLGGIGVSFASSRLSALNSVTVVILAVLGLTFALFALFATTGLFLGLGSPLTAVVVSFAGTTAYRRFAEERARRKIRNIFQRQVGKAVADQLIQQGEKIELGGESRAATVYFSDIAGFSAISEKLPAHDLVELLNEYFTAMCEPVVEKYGGYLDKFEGDAILAVFGIPLAGENHARDACYAALENQKALTDLRRRFASEDRPGIHQRIGISSGEMVVGYVGSPQRHDYTVIGDAVNLGQRLEAANKLYGTSIIIGEATREAAGDFVETRELDLARVPGREKPVRLYELVAKKGELPEAKREAFELFARALALYRQRSYREALGLFRETSEALPDDGPSLLYIDRCEKHISSPRDDNWDGVHDVSLK